jgi:ABC transporter substrate binding protein/Haemolysin-III related
MTAFIGRREFITLLGGAAAWPLAAGAQQTKRIFKVGHLESGLPSSSPYLLAAFQEGLRKLGYIEGENLFIERRYAEGLEERLPQLAAELVRFGVDVIFAIGPPQALAAARATSTIPVVFVGGGDPVAIGLVKSLARPGGNVTGLTLVTVELAAKRIQLLKEVVYDRAEIIADGAVHAIGVCLGLIGAVTIVVIAVKMERIEVTPILIYVIGLVTMLALSAAYNMWPVSRAKWVLRRFDHSAIYLLIAGTYTPFLAQMKSVVASAGLGVGVWLSAAIGNVLARLLVQGPASGTPSRGALFAERF